MNDEIRELLSAYLDGALSEPARRELETRLAGSEDLRRELAELRAVAEAVRALPKHDVPAGFVARVQASRARGVPPRRDWVILPPSLRPVAAALSFGVVALWIWQDVAVRKPVDWPVPPAAPAARLSAPSEAPLAQLNMSGPVSGKPLDDELKASESALGLAPPDGARPSLVRARAKGRALDESPETAAAAPAPAEGEGAPSAGGPAVAMSEQTRSARNVEMFADLERQKRAMGITAVAPSADASGVAALRGAGLVAATPPPAPVVAQRVPRMAMAKKTAQRRDDSAAATASAAAPAPASASADKSVAAQAAPPSGRPAPDAGLVLTDAGSLASSWVLLGYPNDPPKVDFAKSRVLLIKPSVSRIVSVTATADAVVVVYRSLTPDETSDPARDRFALLPLEPDAVQILDATPR
jgi:hypothetical protein